MILKLKESEGERHAKRHKKYIAKLMYAIMYNDVWQNKFTLFPFFTSQYLVWLWYKKKYSLHKADVIAILRELQLHGYISKESFAPKVKCYDILSTRSEFLQLCNICSTYPLDILEDCGHYNYKLPQTITVATYIQYDKNDYDGKFFNNEKIQLN